MKEIKKFFDERDQFAKLVGIELLDVGLGSARARLEIKPHHHNGVGSLHGGVIFTLADLVFAAASNSHGQIAVGLHTSTSYVKAKSDGTIYAIARERSCSRSVGLYAVDVIDEQDQLVATFEGVAYRKTTRLDEIGHKD